MRNETFWKWFDDECRPKSRGRAGTFGKMLEHLDSFDRPVVIIETGCNRRDPEIDESWGLDGCSTVLFDRYITERNDKSKLLSVDISQDSVELALKWTQRAVVICSDSVDFLGDLARENYSPDLLYLDSFDYDAANPLPSAIHHHAELMAAMPMIRPDTLVAVDDSLVTLDDNQHVDIGGKGFLVAKHMELCGAEYAFCAYQVGWTKVGPARRMDDLDIRELVGRARNRVENDDAISAEHLYRRILAVTAGFLTGQARVAHGEACGFYAQMALQQQRLGTAADWFRLALKADPMATQYRVDMANKCFIPMGNWKSAQTAAEQATKIAPDMPDAWRTLGGVYHELNDAEKAIEAHKKQIELDPTDPGAQLDLATVYLDLDQLDEVQALCERVLHTDRHGDALHCLAMVAYRRHDHEMAIELYKEAIESGARDQPSAHWNMSLALHSIGRYKEGWIEHEFREFQKSNPALYLPMKRFTLPRWNGEPAIKEDGNRAIIHVHYEAGAGDNLCMVRYLRVLAEMGYQVRYECAPELFDLVAYSMPEIEVIPRAVDYPGALGLKPFDYHCPIGSLPAVLGTDIDSVPWSGSYLCGEPKLVEEASSRFPFIDHAVQKVGLCWSSGIRAGLWMAEFGGRKSMHFDNIWPLVDGCWKNGITPISLQVGPERAQQHDILDVLPKKPTWAETAALIANLDLVITVDTAVAHLAGAMGKPVWVMAQKDATSWHFMAERPGASWNTKSPWYPSARVFRQKTYQPHFWDDVVSDIAKELRTWAANQKVAAE